MESRARLTVALAVLLVAAACRQDSPSPTAPRLPNVLASERPDARSGLDLGQNQGQNQDHEVLDRAVIHRTVEGDAAFHAAHHGGGGGSNLFYHGGIGGIGVETTPKIYLVVWGTQWNNNDPSGEIAILQSFYNGIGASSWLNSVTQYCQGIASGSSSCSSNFAGNPAGVLAGVFVDNGASAPSRPSQSQIAAEAVRAAQHFGNASASSNASVQYVIATATHNNSPANRN